MDKDAVIYVAGHRGLVGSALLRHLQRLGYRNLLSRTRAELDLTDQAAVRDFFAAQRPDYVLLAAAKVGGIEANQSYPAQFIRDNLVIQANVIHSAYQFGVKRLLFLGSSCIYPRDCPQPIRESYLLAGPLEPSNRPYAVAKIAGIEMCWSYNRQYGTRFLAVMPTNLYGPGDNYHLRDSHVIPAMIRKLHLAKLSRAGNLAGIIADEQRHGPIPPEIKEMLGFRPDQPLAAAVRPQNPPVVRLWGTGTPRREFLYSDDLAAACVFLMNLADRDFAALLGSEEQDQTFAPPLINIGCGQDLTIRELAAMVKEVVVYQGELFFAASGLDGTPRKLLDVSRLDQLGWRPQTSLPAGLAAAYRDFSSGGVAAADKKVELP